MSVLRASLRVGPVSLVWRPRVVAVTVAAVVLAIAVAVCALGIGDFAVAPERIVSVLLGGGARDERLIVFELRLPRAALALVVGAALGVAGAIVQTTARNALASPDLLGVTAGASAGAVAVIVFGGSGGYAAGAIGTIGVPAAAVVGGLLAAGLVVAILRVVDPGGLQPLLVGVGVSAFFSALVSWMLIAASIDDAARANVWLTGSLNGRSWEELVAATSVVLAGMVVLVPLAPRLATLVLGADTARALGLRPHPITVTLLVVSVVLVSAATAVAGPIAFVALVAPHLARLAAGSAIPTLCASAAVGALLVVASDVAARTVLAPVILPVGAVTAAVGAPFLLWLLARRGKAAS